MNHIDSQFVAYRFKLTFVKINEFYQFSKKIVKSRKKFVAAFCIKHKALSILFELWNKQKAHSSY